MKFIKVKILLLILLSPWMSCGQELSDEEIAAFVIIDSTVVVTADRAGFDTEDFIRLVRNDSSFFEAFQNLRLVSFEADNQMQFFSRKDEPLASYHSRTIQTSDGNCRTMEIFDEKTTGKFFKRKGKYRYYTARMYDRVFFTHGEVCGGEEMLDDQLASKGLQRYYNELKRLIFQPGDRVKVPLIGGKAAIFDGRLSRYYDYFITSKTFTNGVDCYVFAVAVKPEYRERKEGKTVIKYLETFFEKTNLQVLGRKYHLAYAGIFDFDVTMDVELMKIGEKYFPRVVSYDGFWNIPTRKMEKARFTARFTKIH